MCPKQGFGRSEAGEEQTWREEEKELGRFLHLFLLALLLALLLQNMALPPSCPPRQTPSPCWTLLSSSSLLPTTKQSNYMPVHVNKGMAFYKTHLGLQPLGLSLPHTHGSWHKRGTWTGSCLWRWRRRTPGRLGLPPPSFTS